MYNRADCPLLNNDKCKKNKNIMCATWDELNISETKHNSDKKEESLICFMALLNEVTHKNFDYDSSSDVDDDDIPTYQEL